MTWLKPWRLKPWLCAALAVASVGCGSVESLESDGPVAEDAPLPRGAALKEGGQMMPRGLTPDEESLTESDPSQGAQQAYVWQCDPALYGFTASSGAVHFPSEYASTTGLVIGWPSYGCIVPELAELIRTASGRLKVTVLVAAQHQQGARACLGHAGLTAAQLDAVEWLNIPVNGIWVRDYGPEIVTEASGARRLVDMSYYPLLNNTCNNLVGRADDDASPTRLAAAWGGLALDRPKVRLEGGNLQTDGEGTCFRARRVANERNCFSGWCYTEDELNEVIGAAHGCNVIALESMEGGVIDHIDMWMTVLSKHTILVGRYEPGDDDVNAAILDRNAQRLAGMGYRVVRVPMPKPYCKQRNGTCTGKENLIGACDATSDRVWATYMNSIRLGNALAVPVFRWVPESHKATIARQEQEALATYQRELDREFGQGAVTVVPIPSDSIIPCMGSLHCVTMTYR